MGLHAHVCTHAHMHTHTHTPHKPGYTQVTEGWPQHGPGPQGWETQNWGGPGGQLRAQEHLVTGGVSGGCSLLPAETGSSPRGLLPSRHPQPRDRSQVQSGSEWTAVPSCGPEPQCLI